MQFPINLHNVILVMSGIFNCHNIITPEEGFKILSHEQEHQFFPHAKAFECGRIVLGDSSNLLKKEKGSLCLDHSDHPQDEQCK